MSLAQESCIPCQEGGGSLDAAELESLLAQLPHWQVVNQHHLQRRWTFADFQSALHWLNQAGAICEQQGHHADFQLGWGYSEAVIYTHKVDGLTRADFVLAARLDAIPA
jgi:4a-hydroxytetrahydrobiopterin dehydratase